MPNQSRKERKKERTKATVPPKHLSQMLGTLMLAPLAQAQAKTETEQRTSI